MAPTSGCVLEALASLYEREEPVGPGRIARVLDVPTHVVDSHLERLDEFELVSAVPERDAFRLTVTGHEFLQLDVACPDHVVIEISEPSDDCSDTR